MAIEFNHTSVVSTNDDGPEFLNRFTDYELKMLYLNLCGEKHNGYSRPALLQSVFQMIRSLPESELNGFELSLQANHVPAEHLPQPYLQYQPGKTVPKVLAEPYTPPALTTVAGYTPAPIQHNPAQSAPASYTQAAAAPVSVRNSAPRNSGVTVPAEAPKAGSKTGEVWVIAEEVWQARGCPSDLKAIRKEIIERCESRGINSSTASVQYGKWKGTKNI